MNVMLYPRIYPIGDLPENMLLDDPFWAYVD